MGPSWLPAVTVQLVVDRRGGFCLEVTPLFAWALHRKGFSVDVVVGGVEGFEGTPAGPSAPVVHAMVLAGFDADGAPAADPFTAAQRYLCDLGFLPAMGFAMLITSDERVHVDPTDGYEHRLVLQPGYPYEVYALQRRSVGLPGIGGVVNEPGTWEARIHVHIVAPGATVEQCGTGESQTELGVAVTTVTPTVTLYLCSSRGLCVSYGCFRTAVTVSPCCGSVGLLLRHRLPPPPPDLLLLLISPLARADVCSVLRPSAVEGGAQPAELLQHGVAA
jgi:hypothetical protein